MLKGFRWYRHVLCAPEGDGAGGGGGDGAAAAAVAAAAAAAAAAAGGDGKPADGKPADGQPKTWFEPDWRQRYATGADGKVDDSKLKRLERYGEPGAAFDALLSVQQRIGSGEFRSVLPKDAKDEQIAAWRAENGIPAAADKYELKLRDGQVIGEADKPIIDSFLKSAHGANLNTAQASAVTDWYYDEIERQTQQRADMDRQAAEGARDALIAAWGTDYKLNTNLVQGLLDAAPADVRDKFMHGRLADGTPIMGDAKTMQWLNSLARTINPVSTLIPNAGANIVGSINDEIASIEKNMRAPKGSQEWKAYWEDPKVSGQGGRYSQLLDGRERAQAGGQK